MSQIPDPPGGVGQFSLNYYRSMLTSAIESGYVFREFSEVDSDWSIFLRHDLDISLVAAARLAKIECDLGIQSTFLPLLHTPSYNLLSSESLRLIESIMEHGHHLGLHYDPVFHGDTEETLQGNIEAEIDLLHRIVGVRPRVVSFHRPTKLGIDYCAPIHGVINTYSPRFFGEIHYYSDSRYQWPSGCPEELFRARKHHRIQLLIHPFWWNQDPDPVEELIAHEQGRMASELDAYFRTEILPAYFAAGEDRRSQ